MLVSNAGGDDYDTFLRSYRAASELELDELEEIMLLRNALAAKAQDEHTDALNKRK